MGRWELSVTKESANFRFVNVIAILLFQVAVDIWPLSPESFPILMKRYDIVYLHVVDDSISIRFRTQTHDPIAWCGMFSDSGLATSKRAVAEERIRRKPTVLCDDVRIECHLQSPVES